MGYQLLPGSISQQIALIAIDLYVIFGRNVLDDDFVRFYLNVGHNDALLFYIGQWTVTAIHIILCALTVSTEIYKVKAMNEVSMAAGLVLNLLWIVILSKMWWQFPYGWFSQFKFLDGNLVPIDGYLFNIDVALSTEMWIFIEIANVCGLKVTNILFLAIRSCTRHKVTFDKIEDRDELPNTETIKALKPVINSFNSAWIPVVVAFSVKTDKVIWVQESIYFVSIVSAIFVTIMIFVHWQKGPAWYTRISPYLFYGIAIFTYVVSPIYMFTMLSILLVWTKAGLWYDSVYYIYFLFIYMIRMQEYFTKIRPFIKEIRLTMKL